MHNADCFVKLSFLYFLVPNNIHFLAEIPENEYIKYFGPEHSLKIPNGHIENLNSKSYLGTIKQQVLENLRCIQHAPSVQMQEVSSFRTFTN
ncbi:putative histone deacetylase 10 [Vitis vinifera]|uniref:Putative histone deacetylase 10 n=1 Tax=Vitis vinifera TaxID=29760 RepID=A0A438F2V7_VITVI|nr:putative histone deacetylase 10 [Vitis vinifera]